MARINIELPQHFTHRIEIPIRITDLNYGGHVGNDTFLSLLHESRMQWFKQLGYQSEIDIEGLGVIQTDAALVYKSEVFYGETIIIELAAADFNKYGFDVVYRLSGKHSGKELLHAKTGLVFFNYQQRKIASMPEGFIQKVNYI